MMLAVGVGVPVHEALCTHATLPLPGLCASEARRYVVAEPGPYGRVQLYVRVRVGANGTGDEIGERNGPHEITAVFMKF